jgi:hypothetical protein
MQLKNLKNKKDPVDFDEFFDDSKKGLEVLNRCGAATAASDNGAINIWIDDDDLLRGNRCVFMSVRDEFEGGGLEELREWLDEQIPLIH